jgi:hypothetical protein
VSAQYGACVAYFRAQCNRGAVCRGYGPGSDPCPTVTDSCPDVHFSTGSLRTVEGLQACARTWEQHPCPEVLAGHPPTCAIAGSLADGAGCIFDTQCSGGFCAGVAHDPAHPACGTCGQRALSGGVCREYDSCPYGEECHDGRCTQLPPSGLPAGAVCERFGDCLAPNYCLADASDPSDAGRTMRCRPLPVLGQPCTEFCNGSLCTAAHRCETYPPAGAPCKREANIYSRRFYCDAASVCDEAAPGGPTCRPRPAAGGACKADARYLEQHECAAGLVCACADAGCTTGVCVERRQVGDACDDGKGRCVPGTECRDGHCVAAWQGVVARRCGSN